MATIGPMITVHHLKRSRSHRVLWLLEELEVPYEIRAYDRDPRSQLAPPELRSLHPLGKSPVVTDGDRVVAESGAILEYLIDRHGQGKLRPTEEEAALAYRYWLHYAEASFMPYLLLSLVFSRVPAGVPWPIRPVAKGIDRALRSKYLDRQITTHLKYIDQRLSEAAWFAGDAFSAADIQMSYPIEAAERREGVANYSHLGGFLERIRARPAYRAAVDKGGPVLI